MSAHPETVAALLASLEVAVREMRAAQRRFYAVRRGIHSREELVSALEGAKATERVVDGRLRLLDEARAPDPPQAKLPGV